MTTPADIARLRTLYADQNAARKAITEANDILAKVQPEIDRFEEGVADLVREHLGAENVDFEHYADGDPDAVVTLKLADLLALVERLSA